VSIGSSCRRWQRPAPWRERAPPIFLGRAIGTQAAGVKIVGQDRVMRFNRAVHRRPHEGGAGPWLMTYDPWLGRR